MYYTVEAISTDGHKASHGLSATAELLVTLSLTGTSPLYKIIK